MSKFNPPKKQVEKIKKALILLYDYQKEENDEDEYSVFNIMEGIAFRRGNKKFRQAMVSVHDDLSRIISRAYVHTNNLYLKDD